MRIKFSFLILIATIGVSGTSLGQLKEPMKVYYYHVNKAELAIIAGNYSVALSNYDSAFSENTAPFAKDSYNAAICYTLLKKYEKCDPLLRGILEKGYSIEKLKLEPSFREYFKTEFGSNLLKYAQTKPFHFNTKLRHSLDSLAKMDQLFRIKEGKYVVYGDTIRKIDRSNVAFLNKIIEQYGFPGENIIGVADSSLTNPPYGIIIIHQTAGAKNRVFDYSDIVKRAILEGEVDAKSTIYLLSRSMEKDLYGTFDGGVVRFVVDSAASADSQYSTKDTEYTNSTWYIVALSESKLAKINAARKEVGLENLDEYRRKIIFSMTNKQFVLGLNSGANTYIVSKKEEVENFSKNLIPVK
jgi:hypothetical protein